MPLGVVNPSEFQKELINIGVVIPETGSPILEDVNINVIDINRGRGNKLETPEPVRAFIAGEAISGASPDILSKEFGVSRASIAAYKNSATSTSSYNKPDANLLQSNNEVRARIIGPAQARLIQAIEAITPEKLDEAGLKVVSGVARDMSAVIKNMEPEANQATNVQVNLFRPRIKEEDSYEVISVNE